MRIRSWIFIVFMACLAAPCISAADLIRSSRPIGAGATWQTDCFVIDSNVPGPVVMIVGGVHGNEPAGARAADQIRNWPITSGKLIVVPRANTAALDRHKRLTPDMPADTANLNRNFPKTTGGSPLCPLSRALWDVVLTEKPDWLVDLHEGYDFTQINSKSVGSSVIAVKSPEVTAQARRMLDALNTTIEDPNKQFVLKGPPADGSLARAAAHHLGIKAMILETTSKSQPLALRVRQHHIMVRCLLTDLGMLAGDTEPADEADNSDKETGLVDHNEDNDSATTRTASHAFQVTGATS